jgi:hypothetical protein
MSKIDLKNEIAVTDIEAEELAKNLNIKFMKVSSKDGIMVNEVFEKLAIEHFKISNSSNGLENIENLGGKLHVKNNFNDDVEEIKSNRKGNESHRSNKDIGFKLGDDEDETKDIKKKKKKDCCK